MNTLVLSLELFISEQQLYIMYEGFIIHILRGIYNTYAILMLTKCFPYMKQKAFGMVAVKSEQFSGKTIWEH